MPTAQARENRVGRLDTLAHTLSVFATKKGLRGNPGPAVHDNLVEPKSTADRPNTLWLTDITGHRH